MLPADPTRRWRGPDAGSPSTATPGTRATFASSWPARFADTARHRPRSKLFWQAFVSHPSLATYQRLLDEAAEPRSSPGDPDHPAGWQQRCEQELRSRLSRLDGRVPDGRGVSSAAVPRAAEALVEILAYEGRVEEAWNAATVHGCAERMRMTLARTREKTHPSDAMDVYEPRVLELINQKKNYAYQSAVDLMDRIRRLADAANDPDRFRSLLERVRTEHRAKRNLKRLLDAKGW